MISIFASSFIAVFLLGLQSQFVRDKQMIRSFITSLCLGTCQLFMYKQVPNASIEESVIFVVGGAIGIVVSIIVHSYLKSNT